MALAEKMIVAYTSMALVFSVGSANVAQLVEQRIRNAWVAGSSPAVGSIEFAGQSLMRLAFFAFLETGKTVPVPIFPVFFAAGLLKACVSRRSFR